MTGAIAAILLLAPEALVFDLGLHVVNVGYQRAASDHVVAQAGVGLYLPWTVNYDVLGVEPPGTPARDVIGPDLRVRVFIHPSGGAPAGFWLSPFAQAAIVRGGDQTGFALAGGVSAGWTWIVDARWLIAFGAGVQVHAAWFGGSTAHPGFAQLAPTLDLNVALHF